MGKTCLRQARYPLRTTTNNKWKNSKQLTHKTVITVIVINELRDVSFKMAFCICTEIIQSISAHCILMRDFALVKLASYENISIPNKTTFQYKQKI